MSSSSIAKRHLGKDGPKVNPLGFGAMGFSVGYGPAEDTESIKVLQKAVEEGVEIIDTSNTFRAYGIDNHNEKLIGSLLSDSEFRSKVFICTKFGVVVENGVVGAKGTPEYARECCERSLRNLQVDQIDLYYQHRVDRSIPIEETWKELKKLQEEGKVKYLGISEATADEIRRAHAIVPISALQIEFSLWVPDIRDNGILNTCRELGIAIVAYSPLGRGVLTGTYRSAFPEGDWRNHVPRLRGEEFQQNLKFVDALKGIADKKGITPAQLSLAWVLAQGDDVFVIPGTKKIKYLNDNLGAGNVTLTKEELLTIEDIVANIKLVGARAPEPMAARNAF
ncbi:Aldo/keto reductase [Serendipita vermifera]|nr:Aldo/keto reductase [Serendipita vermifera]